jgi:nucleoside-diphosphate-sugar epimerase
MLSHSDLHVVLGAGQIGCTLADHLADMGVSVRVVSMHRPSVLADGVDWRAADVTDPEAAIDAAKGASVLYQCQLAASFAAPVIVTAAGYPDLVLPSIVLTIGQP